MKGAWDEAMSFASTMTVNERYSWSSIRTCKVIAPDSALILNTSELALLKIVDGYGRGYDPFIP